MPAVPPAVAASPVRGRSLVVGIVLLGLAAAATGIAYQRLQTRRCLAFYGPEVARLVVAAPRVELLVVAPGSAAGRLVAVDARDVSAARGLVHLRRGLVEDANFDWRPAAGGRLPEAAWDAALVFTDPAGATATLVVDLDDGGSLAVVGRPGRVGLGRIARGLRKWVGGL
ncbi:MAG: hypothetical protein EBZ74_12650 [Planctomycetia bacterium]|nr:hypothetical protein [Planctomycetia bacterium]